MADDNQDIYPLGQGGGLMKDILNFALNNIYQYGQKLGKESESNAQALDRIRAGGKSGLSTAGLQPMLGPNVVGQISPTNWASFSPEAKAILTETFNKFPRLFQRVQKTPSNLHVSVGNENALANRNASGVMRSVNPYYDEIQLGKTERMTSQPSKSAVGDAINWKSIPGDEMRPDLETAVHELQHHVNQPRLQQARPEDAADQATIGLLLKDLMYNKDISSLQNRADQYRLALGDKPTWSRDIVSPHAKDASGYNFRPTPWSQFLGGAMADEGLAYLANNSMNDPKLAALAEQLGVNPGHVIRPSVTQFVKPGPSLMDEVWSSINSMRNKLAGEE